MIDLKWASVIYLDWLPTLWFRWACGKGTQTRKLSGYLVRVFFQIKNKLCCNV